MGLKSNKALRQLSRQYFRAEIERLEQRAYLAGDVSLLQNIYDDNLPEVGYSHARTAWGGTAYLNGYLYFMSIDPAKGTGLWKTDGTDVGSSLVLSVEDGALGWLTVSGNNLFFSRKTDDLGYELWATDGTTGGTKLVKDIATGPLSAKPAYLTDVNGTLFFTFDHGSELSTGAVWKSDGTEAGTVEVVDPNLAINSSPQFINKAGGLLYFASGTDTALMELWRTDGTPEGSFKIGNYNFGHSSNTVFSAVLNSEIYFHAGGSFYKSAGTAASTIVLGTSGGNSHLASTNDAVYFAKGNALWITNGTPLGTKIVASLSSTPYDLTTVGNLCFFVGYTSTTGYEVWVSNGTAAGTAMVKEIVPGVNNNDPADLVAHNGMLYFLAGSTPDTRQIWKSDGTAAGTQMVTDFVRNVVELQPVELQAYGNSLYFYGHDGFNGQQLWKSDGTAAGTRVIKYFGNSISSTDITNLTAVQNIAYFSVKGVWDDRWELWKYDELGKAVYLKSLGYNEPADFFAFGNQLLFVSEDAVNGRELWVSDGTSAGTKILIDIRPGNSSSGVKILGVFGGNVYFTANTSDTVFNFWRTDGTVVGTSAVAALNPQYMTELYGKLYFIARDSSGTFLWTSDGTTAGTTKLLTTSLFSKPSHLTRVGNQLFFYAGNTGNATYDLWKSDGTQSGTVRVKDLDSTYFQSSMQASKEWNNKLVFTTWTSSGKRLWISDGTSAGTFVLKTVVENAGTFDYLNLYSTPQSIYFTASSLANGTELWKSDGTPAGTTVVQDLLPGARGSNPKNIITAGNTLYYSADDGNGAALWMLDSPASPMTMIKDILPGAGNPNISSLIWVNGKLLFQANDGIHGDELWASDGTAEGTAMVENLTIPYTSGHYEFTEFAGYYYFVTDDGVHGEEIWRTDGTAAGTHLFKEFYPGLNGSYPRNFTVAGNVMYFTARDPHNGYSLWKTDGTVTGTNILKNIDQSNTTIDQLMFDGTRLFFTAYDSTHGSELWTSDGTTAGTTLLTDIYAGTSNSSPSAYYTVGGLTYFHVYYNNIYVTNGTAEGTRFVKEMYGAFTTFIDLNGEVYFGAQGGFWKTDGTEEGTVLIKSINLTTQSEDYNPPPVVYNGKLYFFGKDGTAGVHLWSSDGTTEGTNIVASFDSAFYSLFLFEGQLYFTADDGIHGSEIWRTDGTSAGTKLVTDLTLGATSSSFVSFLPTNGALYFTLSVAVGGSELWKTDGTSSGTIPAGEFNSQTPSTLNSRIHYLQTPPVLKGVINGKIIFSGIDTANGYELRVLNESPLGIETSTALLIEGPGGDRTVAKLSTLDPISGESFDYSLAPGEGAIDNQLFYFQGDELRTVIQFDANFKSKYSIRVRSTDSGGLVTEQVFVFEVIPLTRVESVIIGDGTKQRSTVKELTINFNTMISFQENAFQIIQRGTQELVELVINSQINNGKSSIVLRFTGELVRPGTQGLLDGNYEMLIDSMKINSTLTGLSLDGNNDGLAGGNFRFGHLSTDNFFAMLGDLDGDRDVDALNLLTMRMSLNKLQGQSGYNASYDTDGDGDVDALDFLRFQKNMNKVLTY
jgi:ELWxxDGT repeat protein